MCRPNLRKKGQIISDADILIGSTALINDFGVVTCYTPNCYCINCQIIENPGEELSKFDNNLAN